jgi:succinyl-CoA synthetase alpha subunit
MAVRTLIKKSEYHDSVTLMLAARDLSRLEGVQDAAVVMATEANKALLREAGMLSAEAEAASPNDLVIAVSGSEAALEPALGEAGRLLQKKTGGAGGEGAARKPRSLRAALKAAPEANVAVISVAGRYAAAEAWEALRAGLHVLLFSDNVSLEDECALKTYACEHGLLLMGPGAGTAILNGVALGFANVTPPGPVGIVSAAGTGLQEVSTLLAKRGVGLTQGIGTGGRDLKEEVGGLMMLAGLQALQADPATEVIVLVSKPPSAAVAQKVLDGVSQGSKPTVVCFLGADKDRFAARPGVQFARTLEEAAVLGAAAVKGEASGLPQAGDQAALEAQAAVLRAGLRPGQHWLRGLFSGGTLCYEAQVIWADLLDEPVFSNAPLRKGNTLPDSTRSQGHSAVDLGEEEFTVGRPHPMIDNDLRIRRLLQEARDPEVGVLFLDVVIGYGAHPDPAGELGQAVRLARAQAAEAGRELAVIASVTGTEGDPQGLTRQVQTLEAAGVTVCESNAAAARLAASVLQP